MPGPDPDDPKDESFVLDPHDAVENSPANMPNTLWKDDMLVIEGARNLLQGGAQGSSQRTASSQFENTSPESGRRIKRPRLAPRARYGEPSSPTLPSQGSGRAQLQHRVVNRGEANKG